MFHTLILGVALLTTPVLASPSNAADAFEAGERQATRMQATLTGDSQAIGRAMYSEVADTNSLMQQFGLDVSNLTPKSEYKIFINDEPIGVLETDEFGMGQYRFGVRRHLVDPKTGQLQPQAFPRLRQGDVIEVGPVKGSFS